MALPRDGTLSSYAQFAAACRAYLNRNRPQAGLPTKEQDPGPHQLASGWEWREDPRFPHTAHLHRSFTVFDRPRHSRSSSRSGGGRFNPVGDSLGSPDNPESDQNLEDFSDNATDDDIEDDPSCANSAPAHGSQKVDERSNLNDLLGIEQSICFSATWRVPILYFSAWRGDGTPLSLEALLRSPIFVTNSNLPDNHAASFSATKGYRDANIAGNYPDAGSTDRTEAENDDTRAVFPSLSQGDHPRNGTPSWYLHPCETAAWIASVRGAAAEEAEGAKTKVPQSGVESGERDEEKQDEQAYMSELADYMETFMMLAASAVEMRP